ncbi:MAG: S-adenosylmethionine:tRNA ribosyltransferase-isomerase, partial [Ilumatobacteraceae bacterium]
TTVVRGLETAGDDTGVVQPIDGWTDLVITPERGVRVIDGLLTGWHEPEASHLMMLEAVAGRPLLEASYAASLREGYLWHEFGDMHLILP